ncbi:hypothetical protein Cob_v011156 [Colletotrichum orbiculare MAFF 240422]|uniref:Uncharacterized protein n=1 Tax=Colletotrichum orbiculare (strain 104-T / ATCC 96160 / CBS 514.97 / LARS 414 / MAFF 240422) TaxID=1213857 RepID=A0A484FDT1_COLOR|nr:hypothetical protein Cob_v011156 [Colletotrichum orbiculare MAFF 240422]
MMPFVPWGIICHHHSKEKGGKERVRAVWRLHSEQANWPMESAVKAFRFSSPPFFAQCFPGPSVQPARIMASTLPGSLLLHCALGGLKDRYLAHACICHII